MYYFYANKSSKLNEIMSEIADLLRKLTDTEEFKDSKLSGVRFFMSTQQTPREPIVFKPGIFIIAQGRKVGYLGDMVFQFDCNNYLVTSVPTPFECASYASPEEPLLGIYIDIDMPALHEMISVVNQHNSEGGEGLNSSPKCLGPAILDKKMEGAVIQLLKCLSNDIESRILGDGLVKEILYRALCGTQAHSLYALAKRDSNFARISSTLHSIHTNYACKIDVENLSHLANMSVPTFHRIFKEVTSESPVQYLKKIRLNKAKELIASENIKVNVAVYQVGYESISQFNREFKRYFGCTPTSFNNKS